MAVETERLIIKRINGHGVEELKPLLKYQELFQKAGLLTMGAVDEQTLLVLARNEIILMLKEKDTGEALGIIVLLNMYGPTGMKESRKYEVGYLLIPSAQHHGYMREALDATCGELNKRQISVVAEVDKGNLPSQQVLKRCGFKLTAKQGDLLKWQR